MDQLSFNAGGHANHEFFWESLSPVFEKGGQLPRIMSPLTRLISAQYGGFDNFMLFFNAESKKLMGSGWAWLVFNTVTNSLEYLQTDVHGVVTEDYLVPLLAVDVWEHAWYADYENRKDEYFDNIWRIVNWSKVEQRLLEVI